MIDMTKYIDEKVAAIYELANNEDDVKKYIRCAIESAYIQGQRDALAGNDLKKHAGVE